MKPIESNLEAILVAIPMLLVLFVSFFKLDECISSPAKPTPQRKGFTHLNQTGEMVFVEPDGHVHRERKRR